MKQLSLFVGFLLLILIFTSVSNITYNENYKKSIDLIDTTNVIYTPGSVFIYDYFFVKNGDTLKCQVLDKKPRAYVSDWKLVKPVEASKEFPIIGKYHLTVTGGTFYQQTEIEFQLFTTEGDTVLNSIRTGVIENSERVWLHPIRSFGFYPTQFSPFPEVRLPLRKGNYWENTLRVAPYKKAKRFIPTYEEKLLRCRRTYQIRGKTKLSTALGTLDCWITKATATNQYGKGHLTSYFNEKYGFVKLEYRNIDDSQLIVDLVECHIK